MLDDYHFSGEMDDGYSDTRTYFSLDYDKMFNWGYWTRGSAAATTRGTDGDYHATSSGCFAK
jgi:hypothetical protein